jgi:hypothetical protein
LAVNLTLPTVAGLYASTTCTSPITITAGATTATCNATAASNTVPGDGPTNVTFTVASGAGYTVGAPASVAVNFVNDDAVTLPTVTIAAVPTALAAGGTSTVTVTSSAAAPAGGLSVVLTGIPVAGGNIASTNCASPIVIAAGATTAVCTVTAAAALTGQTAVPIAIGTSAAYTTGAPAAVEIIIGTAIAATNVAVPTMGTLGIALMGLLLAGFGAATQRRRK